MTKDKPKILIVEYELLIASHLKMLLEQFGYSILDIASIIVRQLKSKSVQTRFSSLRYCLGWPKRWN